MPTRRVPEPVTENRPLLVARLASQLDAYTSPRTHLWIIMVLAGCGAFLTSVVLLWSPADVFELMAPRYAAAAVGGYLVFLLLIRA